MSLVEHGSFVAISMHGQPTVQSAPACNGSRYSGSLAILDALRMWGATRFQAGKSRFTIPDGVGNTILSLIGHAKPNREGLGTRSL